MENLKTYRISSIDLVRGLVMVLMLLDHTRDYFHFGSISLDLDPLDPDQSSFPLYLTRWITHLCAPTFVGLAGTSIFLQKERAKNRPGYSLGTFLFTRGLWLIFLELTLINFAWTFLPLFHSGYLQVIWAIGISMVFMAGFIYLDWKSALGLGILITTTHNLMDGVLLDKDSFSGIVWALIHQGGQLKIGGSWELVAAYPFLPWLGIMLIGFGAGPLFSPSVLPETRRKILLRTGAGMLVSFFALRIFNGFGDPKPWGSEALSRSFWFEFFDVQKYPPSLLYALATLGISCFLLAFMETKTIPFRRALLVFGRVPFFYYLVHIYLIHLSALGVFLVMGGSVSEIDFAKSFGGLPLGFGFGLAGTYLVWISLLLILYPVCAWYDKIKTRHKERWWTSYL
jgi:uncharacterized membrane protein